MVHDTLADVCDPLMIGLIVEDACAYAKQV
jgi:hypothetical protein